VKATAALPDLDGSRAALERYYRLHARIYDATRWTFLFGRGELIRRAAEQISPGVIHEIGCGTGHNLVRLRRCFPRARIVGWDLSEAMLEVARKRLTHAACEADLVHAAYPDHATERCRPDLVVFSYALSMFNPGWAQAIEAATSQLGAGGLLAVVDFHQTPHPWFRSWMRRNHVCLEGQLLPALHQALQPSWCTARPAWGGLWEYFLFLGVRSNPPWHPTVRAQRPLSESDAGGESSIRSSGGSL
jgi:S-adenosylmethionine-diacylgycerolhomoserine-N-methlytransferase